MSNARCTPMAAPDVIGEHYGPSQLGGTCEWWIGIVDRARPQARPVHLWDAWPECSCTQAHQLLRAVRSSPEVLSAAYRGELGQACEHADTILADLQRGWSA